MVAHKLDALRQRIKQLVDSDSTRDSEVWGIPDNCPLEFPSPFMSNSDKNRYLKENFKTVLSSNTFSDEHIHHYYWVIQDWGGIRSYQKSDVNTERIKNFLDEIQNEKLQKKELFNCISSLSKIASFMHPEKFAIYDSRAIYCLNWFLLNHTESHELFPQPSGRNKEMLKLDMGTIIELSRKKYSYCDWKNAYQKYCTLLQALAVDIYGEGGSPHQIETLLFTSLGEVLSEIRASVNLEINLPARNP